MNMSIIFVRILVDTLSNKGVDVDQFLALSDFRAARLGVANETVSVAEFDRLLRKAIELTDEPALGLYMGNSIGLEAFNLFGFLCMSAGNLRTAIQFFIQYHKLLNDYEAPELREEGDISTFVFHYHHTNMEGNRARAEFALAALVRYARVFVGQDKQPIVATFNFQEPSYAMQYAKVFPFPVEFSSEYTSIEFPTAWLDKTQPYPNDNVLRALKAEADKVLLQLEEEKTISEAVYQAIQGSFDGTKPDLEGIASLLNVSGRSLRRHLQTEGVTFSDVMHLAMGDIAKRKLEVASSVQEVAYAMGFSEPSAFSRAFLRWTQLTPQQYKSCPF